MELSDSYRNKLSSLKKALSSFSKAMQLNLFTYSEDVSDVIKNGQVQKFEIASELLWKSSMLFLNEKFGIEATTPKTVYRGLFQANLINELECEEFIKLVDDRNSLSHIYNEKDFELVYKKLSSHLNSMLKLFTKINY